MTVPTATSRVIVGLMSGTSLDGISAAVVRFDRGSDGRYAYELLGMSVRAYEGPQRERLAQALVGSTPREYCRLSFDLGNCWPTPRLPPLRMQASGARMSLPSPAMARRYGMSRDTRRGSSVSRP
jgi:hypothetical protein